MSEAGRVRRKWTNRIMLILCGCAVGLCILILALIVGYTVAKGANYLNVDFLTHTSKPVERSAEV